MGLVALIALGGGGGAAYFFYFKAPAAEARAAEPEPAEHEAEGTGILAMEPFVVNLADEGVVRFLRVNMALVVGSEEIAVELEESALEKARIRSAILELLAQQHADVLATPEGKEALKAAIAERTSQAVHSARVVDVLFTEFVIQF